MMEAMAQGEAGGQDMGAVVMSLGWVWDINPISLLENQALGILQDTRNTQGTQSRNLSRFWEALFGFVDFFSSSRFLYFL